MSPGPMVVSVLSGCLWAVIAVLLGARHFGTPMWGGIVAAPLIGLIAGMASKRFSTYDLWWRATFALISLFVTAGLFGLGVGIFDLFRGAAHERIAWAVLTEPVLAIWWGLAMTGYFLILWPLAHASHSLISRLWHDADAAARMQPVSRETP